ncbi:pentatricopeptide repeat-containing protein At3g58590 [Cornus florida]|uniref:pentatricopeptide repeat-containing protein At3g58590 n=1 Tax=Cornus florida TaxID=4283 RepID=UPI00289F8047|nr:pentatricopeptide repeat-containing protein At3g58590 [Cornus florida]
MRKAASVASKSVQFFNLTHSFSSSQQLLLSISIRDYRHFHGTLLPRPFNGEINHQLLVQLLHEFSRERSLDATKSIHALTITLGSSSPQSIFLNNNIMSVYESLGELSFARKLFDEMPQRNVVSYNTMICAYSRHGNVDDAWKLLLEMRAIGFEPTQFTFGGLLSCASLDLRRGFMLQAMIMKTGLMCADAFAGTALFGLFSRHGCFDEALRSFEEMPLKNLVTWNSMISLFGHHGLAEDCILLFRELMRTEVVLSEYSFVGVLSGFVLEQDLESGEQIHGLVIKRALEYEVSVVNSLINMYVKCSGTCLAEKLFEEVPVRDIVSWNTVIGALAKSDRPGKALELFLEMCVNGVLPNQTTFVSAINSCTSLHVPMHGEVIHAKIIKNMYESDVFVGSALVDLYSKCDKLEEARHSFDEIYDKNLVSWNALIMGYSKKCPSTSVSLLREMIQLDYCPNEFTFSTILKSSFILELKQLHSLIIKMGYQQNEYVLSSLISSYAKSGQISDALVFVAATNEPLPVVPSNIIAGIYNRTGQYHSTQELFAVLEEPDIVSWNILIAACSRNGDYKEVYDLFTEMQMAQIYPDNYTYVSLLSVCTKLCNLALGSSLHGLIIKTDFNCCDIFVCNVMIDMYGKCGSLESSVKVFNEMLNKNLISWTALISALGLHGLAAEALERFQEMEAIGFKPDGVAFIAVLSACRHGGLVKEGKELFGQMKRNYGVEPNMDHYHLVVDLLAKYGNLKEAEQLIDDMPFPPNALIWRSFLQGCKKPRIEENLAVKHVNYSHTHAPTGAEPSTSPLERWRT